MSGEVKVPSAAHELETPAAMRRNGPFIAGYCVEQIVSAIARTFRLERRAISGPRQEYCKCIYVRFRRNRTARLIGRL